MVAAGLTLSERTARLRPTAVNAILGEVREHTAGGRSVVSLMRGEPDFPTPAHITAAAAEALARGRTSYPDNRGERALREAVADKLARDNSLTYDADREILVTTGATFGLYAAFAAVLNDGDEVLVPDPIYDAYHSVIRLCGGVVRPVTAAVRDGRFCLDVDALERAVTPATRVVLLNTPWNPVGTVLRRDELADVGRLVVQHRLLLVCDEIYEAIVYDGHRHLSPASIDPELRDRTIVVNSLSKTYAMTGWRVGYVAAPAALVQAMFLVLQQSSRGPATFIQDAAAVALAGPQDAVEAMRLEYRRRRDLVIGALQDLARVRVPAPEGGFFAMVDLRDTGVPSNDVRRRLLREFDVVVAHGAAYGAAGEGTLRVSFASGGDTLARGLERLRAGLATL